MAPAILLVGATGNTGQGVTQALPELLNKNESFSEYRIIALTRSKDSPAARKLSELPHVEVIEHVWSEITSEWLVQNEVVRIFIAPYNDPTAFAMESQFLSEALHAGVKYVVRVLTTAANVTAGTRAYYARTHWAIEQMLSQPEFEALHWTTLRPNVFFSFALGTAAEYIKTHGKTGSSGKLSLTLDATVPMGVVDPVEVGVLAARLLLLDDTSAYTKARLVINGPEDISGEDVVALVESHTGHKVENVEYRDVSSIHQWADATPTGLKSVIRSVSHALETGWEGKCKASTTSAEVLKLAPPKVTAKQYLAQMLA
jgi:nucleoside-diphosphate-sugar epimerase